MPYLNTCVQGVWRRWIWMRLVLVAISSGAMHDKAHRTDRSKVVAVTGHATTVVVSATSSANVRRHVGQGKAGQGFPTSSREKAKHDGIEGIPAAPSTSIP